MVHRSEEHLMFAGHGAYNFGKDPFYSNGFRADGEATCGPNSYGRLTPILQLTSSYPLIVSIYWVGDKFVTLKSTRYRKVEPAALNRRAVPRHKVEVTSVSLNGKKKFSIPASLVDISIYGCRLEIECEMDEGEEIQVSFATFASVAATIIWKKADEAGCRFADSIDPHMMRALTITH